MNFLEWSAMAVGAYRVMPSDLRASLFQWEHENLGGTTATSDWPGWADLIGAAPKLEPRKAKAKPAALPAKLRTWVFERDRYRCADCGSWRDLTIDHVMPRFRGGTDDPGNLQTLCRTCNSRKGTQ